MTARQLAGMQLSEFTRSLRKLTLRWQIEACERDLVLTQREVREKLIAARHLTKELINLRSQVTSL